MNGEHEGYWDKEEFEDKVARALIAMYEEKISKKAQKGHKAHRISDEDLRRIRGIGCYFPPRGRLVHNCFVDIRNDGLPSEAIWAYADDSCSGIPTEDNALNGYVHIVYARKIQRLPAGINKIGTGVPYEVMQIAPMTNAPLDGFKGYCTIDKEGKAHGVYREINDYDRITGRSQSHIITFNIEGTKTDKHAFFGPVAIGYWQDRRFLWNVQAMEGKAKATFGIYPEQIKSLFYARSLPTTETGRRRPILHWVCAHRRRIKEGTDVDVSRHLRGITEFEMGGTLFRIINPMKTPSIGITGHVQ